MKTHSWWVLFRASIYACAQGMGRFPLSKWNTVLASRQTLWIIAISIFQQTTWDYEFVCSFGFFLYLLQEGEQWAMLLLSHDLCCPDWKLKLFLRPRCWQISFSNTSSRSLAPRAQVNLATVSPVSGAYWRNGACPCSGFQLVNDAASCKSCFYSADGFIFCGLERAFLLSELHEPAIKFTGI